MLTPDQIAARLNGVGGSDSPIVCGLSPWVTAYELWRIKTRRQIAKDISNSPYVKAGNMLEEAVGKWFEFETGKEIESEDKMLVHEKYPWMFANLDGRIKNENAIIEIKTTSSCEGWGDSGSTTIPEQYHLQIAHYMCVTNTDKCYVAVLIRGFDFRHYVIERNKDLEASLLEYEKNFWEEHVQKDIAPEPVNTKDVLMKLNSMINGDVVVATFELEKTINNYQVILRQIKELKDTAETVKTEICIFMGESQVLLGINGKPYVTWRLSKPVTRLDSDTLKLEQPEIYKKYAVQYPAIRRFVLKRKEEVQC